MIFNIAACDDEQDDIETLQKHMQNLSIKMDIDFNITIYNDSQKLLTAYQPGKFQLLFLDVEMPKLDGIELAKKIRAFPDRDVRIIFVSSYPKYMKDSFNVQAFQYLTKPYSEKELCEIIIQIVDDYKHSKIEKTIICTDNSEEIVNLNDIIAIKSFNAKKKILHITTTHKTIETTGIIGDFERKFSEHGFVSPCRGYLINIQHLHYFKDTVLIMSDGMSIPLSRRKERNIRNLFNKNLLIISTKR